jgi:hypothetical protein
MSREFGEVFRTSLHELPHVVAPQALRSFAHEYRPDLRSLIDDLRLIVWSYRSAWEASLSHPAPQYAQKS